MAYNSRDLPTYAFQVLGFISFIYFLIFTMYECFACIYVCLVPLEVRQASGSLELESQMVLIQQVGT